MIYRITCNKIFLQLMLLFIPCFAFSQTPIEKCIVLDIAEGHTQEELYNVLKSWFISQAKESEKNIIQVEITEQGRFVGHLSQNFVVSSKVSTWTKNLRGIPIVNKKAAIVNSLTGDNLTGKIDAALDIQVRSNKIRIQLSNFVHEAIPTSTGEDWSQGIIFSSVPAEMNALEEKKYKLMLEKALPFIDEWWKIITTSIAEYLNNGDPTANW